MGDDETEAQFNFLLSYLDQLRKELDKCESAGAYYAGCFILGTMLEGMLLSMVECYPEEVEQAIRALRKEENITRSPEDWSLTILLKVSFAAGWIPFKGTDDPDQGELGDWLLNYVKEIRNMIHPGQKIRHYADVRLSKRHFKRAREYVELTADILFSKIEESLTQTRTRGPSHD